MLRTYEAAVAVIIVLIALIQFVVLSAGRLGEQWDSTELDVEVKKALQGLQSIGIEDNLEKYSKIRDPDLLRLPEDEKVGYMILVNGDPIDGTVPPAEVEVATADARIHYLSRDAPSIVRTFWKRLGRSQYVPEAGRTMDHDSVDELADLLMGLTWNSDSLDLAADRAAILLDNQNDDGGWGFVGGEESDTLSTSMAIRALSTWLSDQGEDPLSTPAIVQGISWLRAGVHADGGYGARERLESSVDMTSHALLAYLEAGLDAADRWVLASADYITRLQNLDGGFPFNRHTASDVACTAAAMKALMALNGSQSTVDRAAAYLGDQMITEGSFTLELSPLDGTGTYDLIVDSGCIVDCSPRGYQFWGYHYDDSIVGIVDVYGDRDNMTVVLRIERGRLVTPENKQKIALAFSHNMTPDDTDWWILNAGNPHTAGQGDQIDDPKYQQEVLGEYTYLTITDLEVPDEYEFFSDSEDWLIACVGDQSHPIKDNPGWGYLAGYWNPWMKLFDYNNILTWSYFSEKANRVVLDTDRDWEYDDRRFTEGDILEVGGHEWEVGILQDGSSVNLTFTEAELNYTRYFFPHLIDLSTIPPSKSGMYHYGMISILNKPAFSKDYQVVLRESLWENDYDEAYIFDGSGWNSYPSGSIWVENGIGWRVEIEGDFLVLTREDPVQVSGIAGRNATTLSLQGDFLKADVQTSGSTQVWLVLLQGGREIDRVIFDESTRSSYMHVFGTWGGLRESSRAYETLGQAECWLADGGSARCAHDTADLCQQAIKFTKEYNSLVEDKLSIEAWYKSEEGG